MTYPLENRNIKYAEESLVKVCSDPEEQERMKFRALCRFRTIGRLAMENAGWMNEGSLIVETLVTSVSKKARDSILLALQERSVKRKHILSLEDKALLCHPLSWRTDEEKQYLNRIIGGLKCFRRYPKSVRRGLAAVTFFKYFGPGRVVLREGHKPFAMYFVVNGELRETHQSFDIIMKHWIETVDGMLLTGDVFGQNTLLHNIPRSKTVTTVTGCGLLCVMKEDFRRVLDTTIQSHWDDIARSMSRFTYFSTFSEIAIREGCMLAKVESYKVDETIMGDGKGVPNYVYFILSGQCKMVETLLVSVKKRSTKTFYTLYNPKETITVENIKVQVDKKMKIEESKFFQETEQNGSATAFTVQDETKQESQGTQSTADDVKVRKTLQTTDEMIELERIAAEGKIVEQGEHKHGGAEDSMMLGSTLNVTRDWDRRSTTQSTWSSKSMLSSKDSTVDVSNKLSTIKCFENLPKSVKVYFIQVCLMSAGGCFGLGETMKNRRIIAVEDVHCLLLPQHWLWQWNPANIWSRIKHFLDRKIPSTKQVFAEFELNQRWNRYKDNIIKEVFMDKTAVNPTSVHDVPYSIRIDQNFDFGECRMKKKTKH